MTHAGPRMHQEGGMNSEKVPCVRTPSPSTANPERPSAWPHRGGFYFTKIDLNEAYNQIKLTPASQKKLALG